MNDMFIDKPNEAIKNFIWNKILHFKALETSDTKLSLIYRKNQQIQPNLGDLHLEYSINKGLWIQNWNGLAITLHRDDVLYIRNMSEKTSSLPIDAYYQFSISGGKIAGGGSIQYLLKKDGQLNTVQDNQFMCLFKDCISLVTAPELPATQLAVGCYDSMFSGCTSLKMAPALPATSLTDSCYYGMFRDCVALVTTPELPAMNLAEYCYAEMFLRCISITNSKLPAIVLSNCCYWRMFEDCISLITAPEFPAIQLAFGCYASIVAGCNNFAKVHMKKEIEGIYEPEEHGDTTKTVIYDL